VHPLDGERREVVRIGLARSGRDSRATRSAVSLSHSAIARSSVASLSGVPLRQ
jgi:hypothetical protein